MMIKLGEINKWIILSDGKDQAQAVYRDKDIHASINCLSFADRDPVLFLIALIKGNYGLDSI